MRRFLFIAFLAPLAAKIVKIQAKKRVCTFSISVLMLLTSSFSLVAQSFNWGQRIETMAQNRFIDLDSAQTIAVENEGDLAVFLQNFKRSSTETMLFPLPNGEKASFRNIPSHTLHPDLAQKYPEIIAGKAYADESGFVMYYEYSPYFGFRALLKNGSLRYFVDPIYHSNHQLLAFYQKSEMNSAKKDIQCLVDSTFFSTENDEPESGIPLIEGQLYKYRIAIATTGEYGQYHGGTKASAMAAITTTLNRVNSVYEPIGISMELVPNNDLVVFTDPATHPFSSNTTSAVLNEITAILNQHIGSSNYDMGHGFCTGFGGLASISSVCDNNNKARAATGLSSPIGDPFDIDFVAHEIGHQFGARHTQNNSCQRDPNSAYEPYSASTIMGYAGLCNPNLQNQSDDYFHIHSIREITEFLFQSSGSSCATPINTSNNSPIISLELDALHSPVNTPFYLSASAVDLEGDSIRYCWEQYDLGLSSSPSMEIGPIYRSFQPKNTGIRYFPEIQTVAQNISVLGDPIASEERTLTFRLSTRDHHPFGGAVSYTEVNIDIVGNDPFVVTIPNSTHGLHNNIFDTVRWDVSNTTISPINCQQIEILVSVDNADHFFSLGTYPNTGEAVVDLSGFNASNAAFIMIKAVDGIFYNISSRFALTELISRKKYSEEKLHIYPNPSTGIFHIEGLAQEAKGSWLISVYDITGRRILHQSTPTKETVSIDLSEFPPAAYILWIENECCRYQKRLYSIKN